VYFTFPFNSLHHHPQVPNKSLHHHHLNIIIISLTPHPSLVTLMGSRYCSNAYSYQGFLHHVGSCRCVDHHL